MGEQGGRERERESRPGHPDTEQFIFVLFGSPVIATCAVRDVIIRGPFEAFRPLNAGSDTSRLRDPARTFPSSPRPSLSIPLHPDRSHLSPSFSSLPRSFLSVFQNYVQGKGGRRRRRERWMKERRIASPPPPYTQSLVHPSSLPPSLPHPSPPHASRSDRRCLDGIYTSKAAKGDIMARPDFTRCRPVRRPRG